MEKDQVRDLGKVTPHFYLIKPGNTYLTSKSLVILWLVINFIFPVGLFLKQFYLKSVNIRSLWSPLIINLLKFVPNTTKSPAEMSLKPGSKVPEYT